MWISIPPSHTRGKATVPAQFTAASKKRNPLASAPHRMSTRHMTRRHVTDALLEDWNPPDRSYLVIIQAVFFYLSHPPAAAHPSTDFTHCKFPRSLLAGGGARPLSHMWSVPSIQGDPGRVHADMERTHKLYTEKPPGPPG